MVQRHRPVDANTQISHMQQQGVKPDGGGEVDASKDNPDNYANGERKCGVQEPSIRGSEGIVLEHQRQGEVRVLFERAQALEGVGDLSKAEEVYKKILEMDPRHAGGFLWHTSATFFFC